MRHRNTAVPAAATGGRQRTRKAFVTGIPERPRPPEISKRCQKPRRAKIATEQVRGGDWIRVDYDPGANILRFARECEGLPVQEMARLVDTSVSMPEMAAASGASVEPARIQTARSSKRS